MNRALFVIEAMFGENKLGWVNDAQVTGKYHQNGGFSRKGEMLVYQRVIKTSTLRFLGNLRISKKEMAGQVDSFANAMSFWKK